LFSFGLLLLFLFGGKKKKVTKRKTAVCSFKAAARLHPAEAQELASLKQPALLFAVLRFSAFRLETEDGIFSLACSSPFGRNRCVGRWGFCLCFFAFLLRFLLWPSFGRNRCVGRWGFCLCFLFSCFAFCFILPLGEIAGVSVKLLLAFLCALLSSFFSIFLLGEIAGRSLGFFLSLREEFCALR